MTEISASEPKVRTILCYGDSNTWGFIPGGWGNRYPYHVRWPGAMAGILGDGYRVIEEGLCGRTTAFDDPLSPGIDRNGLKMIGAVLDSHKPLDLVIIFLGTNDLKMRFSLPSVDIATGVEKLVQAAANPVFGAGRAPDILVICPPNIWEVEDMYGPSMQGGREKSLQFREVFRQLSRRIDAPIFYAEEYIQSDSIDGAHLSAESHLILGRELARWVVGHYGGAPA